MSDNLDDFEPDQDEGPGDAPKKSSQLKQLWEGSPVMKLGAVAVGAAVLFGGYMLVFGGASIEETVSKVGRAVDVKQAPGEGEVDPAYQEAVQKENQQRADAAQELGDSAIPTPIATIKGRLKAEETLSKPAADPLKEWRALAEARHMARPEPEPEPELPPEQQSDIVPMIQPARPQVVAQQMDPELVNKLVEQMRAIIIAQAPKDGQEVVVTRADSKYATFLKEEAEEKRKQEEAAAKEAADAEADEAAGGTGKDASKLIVAAGTVSYGQILTELNSDVPTPLLVAVHSGPLAGGRAIGSFQKQEEHLILNFTRIVKDGVSYKMNGIALDPDTTLAGMQTDVDHHYLTRIVLPAAAEFVKGMAGGVAQTTQDTTVGSGGATTTSAPALDTTQEAAKGLEKAAEKVSDILTKGVEKPITVKVKKGTPIGILFLDPIKEKDIE